MSEELYLKSNKIAFKHTPQSHTSLNLKKLLESILSDYHIKEKVLSGSSDTARNIRKCLSEQINLVYVPCLCHIYILMVIDELVRENEVESLSYLSIFEMLVRIRKLVGLFKHSNKLSAQLCSHREE